MSDPRDYQQPADDALEFWMWCEEQSALHHAEEEFKLSPPKGWDKIEADDSIGELETFDDNLPF